MIPHLAPGISRRCIVICLGLLAIVHSTAADSGTSTADQARLRVVIAFADKVLDQGRDTFHPQPTPLLANGINVLTGEPLIWRFIDGREAVLSDFTIQQNFMRVLVSLTNLTGEPRYKATAKANYAYYFDHFQDEGGLLRWGGHCAIDLKTLQVIGPKIHELKNAYPYYELMFEVNPEAAARYIRGYWNAHVYNFSTLEISRHGEYGHPLGTLWASPFDNPPPFFATKGLSFLDAGNDLIYSASMLYKYTGDRDALRWGLRLAEQYVKARNPKTKLGAYQYTQARQTANTTDDTNTLSWFGDRAHRQFGPELAYALEGTMLLPNHAATIYSQNALMQVQLALSLGAEGRQLLADTHEGMAAFVHLAYQPENNLLRPMMTDGTDLSNYALKRNGYYGPVGRIISPYSANAEFMLSYARAFLATADPDLWAMARGIAHAADLGEIGVAPGKGLAVNLNTKNDDPYVLFSLLDLYGQSKHPAYLDLARKVGDNIVSSRYHHGFFLPERDLLYAKINAIEPYALLALEATIRGHPELVPTFLNGSGFFDTEYRFTDGSVRRIQDGYLFTQRQGKPLDVPHERFIARTME